MPGQEPPWADATEKDTERSRVQTVQVRLVGSGTRTYDYAVPAELGMLEPGQWVRVPGNVVSEDGSLGRVESCNPPSWKGALKEIVALAERPDPWTARFEALRTRDEASRIYRKAYSDPEMTQERLEALVAIGHRALAKAEQQAARRVEALRAQAALTDSDGQDALQDGRAPQTWADLAAMEQRERRMGS